VEKRKGKWGFSGVRDDQDKKSAGEKGTMKGALCPFLYQGGKLTPALE
jgi:hypothetical protein